MSWYLTCLRRYADFNGRASRSELWWFVLPNAAVATVLNALARAMIPEVNPYTGSFEGGSVPGMLFFVVLSLAFDLAY